MPITEVIIVSIRITWDNTQHTVLRFELAGEWDQDVFLSSLQTTRIYLDTAHQPVSFIVSVHTSFQFPSSILSNIRRILSSQHPSCGQHLVFVGCEAILKPLDQIVRQAYGRKPMKMKTHFTDSLESARMILQQDCQ